MRAMTSLFAALTVLGLTFGLPGTASAETARYTMTPTEGGFIRMDTQTGVLSFCSRKGGSMACDLVPDDRLALQRELDDLKKSNRELKDENRKLEEMLLGSDGKGGSRPELKIPSEEDVDKALSYVERMYKKFRDKLRELQKEDGRGPTTPL